MTTLEMPPMLEWTPEALQRLPADFRYEVREGNLVMMAAAMRPWHTETQDGVKHLLRSRGCHAYSELGVIVTVQELRTCDVGVLAEPAGTNAYYPAAAFTLLVEIVSDSSRREAREIKPRLYAEARVPEYWWIEEGRAGEAIVYQYELLKMADGPSTYAETRVTTLAALEAASPG